MREPTFPRKVHLSVPESLHEELHDAARHEGQTASEFIRSAIRDRLRAVATEQPVAGD